MNEQDINLLSPGPYVWGIIMEGEHQKKFIDGHFALGSGDVHTIILTSHPGTDIGKNPTEPEHAVLLCMTGNGPNSKNNARALCCLLSQREELIKNKPTGLPIPVTPDAVAWAEYAITLEHALGIADPIPESLKNWRPC